MRTSIALLTALTVVAAGCRETAEARPAAETASKAQPAAAEKPAVAEPGKPAPDFELKDLDGKTVKLSDFKGRTVVLEWFNPGCPYVVASHTKGSLVDTADRWQKEGVVWLAINSGAPGKQGHGVETNRKAAEQWKMNHPVLLDETGKTGRAYGATNTPHMYVIDPAGTLVYAGAIDNSPDGEGASPKGGKLVRYVDDALAALRDGRPVEVAQTKAYGCTVKFAN